MEKRINKWHAFSICLLLVVLTLAVFWQARQFEFVSMDDGFHVTDNPHVRNGFTWDGVGWAFKWEGKSAWDPLVWLGHMAVCQFWGASASAHHLANVALHAANVLLLFWVLNLMTSALWRSAIVASLFALHPLNVESVAWVSANNTLISTFFLLLSLWAYVSHAMRRSFLKYALSVVCFALASMAKPIVVVFPLVFLLLDWWPLKRFQIAQTSTASDPVPYAGGVLLGRSSVITLILEKIPFLILAVVFASVTLAISNANNALHDLSAFPLGQRFVLAAVAIAGYLRKTIWPDDLAFLYLIPSNVPALQITIAVIMLAVITALGLWQIKRRAYIAVGWSWCVLALLPVIGLVSRSNMSNDADRYAYLAIIGVFISITWSICDLAEKWRYSRVTLLTAAAVALALSAFCAWRQLGHWKDTVALYERTLAVMPYNYVAHYNLAAEFRRQKNLQKAADHYVAALTIRPDYADAHNNLANILCDQGKAADAIQHYLAALQIRPNDADLHNNLATALLAQGKNAEAVRHFTEALRIKPSHAEAHFNLAMTHRAQGNIEAAVSHWTQGLKINPGNAIAWRELGLLHFEQGRYGEAKSAYKQAVTLNSSDADSWAGLCLASIKLKEIDSARQALRNLENLAPQKAQELELQLRSQ